MKSDNKSMCGLILIIIIKLFSALNQAGNGVSTTKFDKNHVELLSKNDFQPHFK